MTTPPNAPGGRTGAVRDEPRRKKGLLFALLGLLALLLLALLLYLLLRGDDEDTNGAGSVGAAAASTGSLQTAASPGVIQGGTGTALPPDGAPGVGGVVVPTAAGSSTPTPGATAVAPVTPAATTPAAPAASAAPSAPAAPTSPAAAATSAEPGGLVGGGAVEATPATGAATTDGKIGTVLFAEDSAVITGQGQRVITEAAARIMATHPAKVVVTGYTDTVAGQPVNAKLSQQRADAVLAALKKVAGPGVTVYSDTARGEADPVASNDTAEGRQANRRATITAS